MDLCGLVAHDGYAIVSNSVTDETLTRLVADREAVAGSAGRRAGVRNLLQTSPAVRELACSPAARRLVAPVLGDRFFPVRAILFDKSPAANWKVAWHQDLAIAVKQRRDAPGFSGWSVKDGVAHVLPPAHVLEKMLTVRLHLDDCSADNGPLRVIPGSHRFGKLSDEQIDDWKARGSEAVCRTSAGAALLIRPLLLHGSSPATSPSHRRVIHIEFSANPLPGGLHWHAK